MDRADAHSEDSHRDRDDWRDAVMDQSAGQRPIEPASPRAASAMAADHPQRSTTSGEQTSKRPRLVDPRTPGRA